MRRLLLPLVLALVVVSGCSGDDDPEPRIAPSDSSSAAAPAPSPTPTGAVEPTLPAEAAGEDAAAAEAFVRFYWEMVNYAQATGDTGGLAGMEAPGCEACVGGRESIEETYASGGTIDGGVAEVLRASSVRLDVKTGKAFRVMARVRSTAQVVQIPGQQSSRHEGGDFDFDFVVQFTDRWKIARWEADL